MNDAAHDTVKWHLYIEMTPLLAMEIFIIQIAYAYTKEILIILHSWGLFHASVTCATAAQLTGKHKLWFWCNHHVWQLKNAGIHEVITCNQFHVWCYSNQPKQYENSFALCSFQFCNPLYNSICDLCNPYSRRSWWPLTMFSQKHNITCPLGWVVQYFGGYFGENDHAMGRFDCTSLGVTPGNPMAQLK